MSDLLCPFMKRNSEHDDPNDARKCDGEWCALWTGKQCSIHAIAIHFVGEEKEWREIDPEITKAVRLAIKNEILTDENGGKNIK